MIYEFTPTQDLHGYNSPWPAGGGKNLLQVTANTQTINDVTFTVNEDGSVALSGTSSGLITFYLNSNLTLPAGTYTVNGCPAGGGNTTYELRIGNIIAQDYGKNDNIANFTLSEETTTNIKIVMRAGQNVTGKVFYPMIRLSSVSDATFAPYSNICPLKGYNIWDPNNQEYVQVYSGYVNSDTRELYLRPVYQEYAGEELVGPWMSSLDPYEEDTTPTEGAFVIDFGGEMTSYELTPFMLQTLLESLGIRQHFTNGARLLNSLMDQAQGRVRSEEELLHLSRPLNVIAIGDQLPAGITFKPISKDVLPGLPGKFIR